MNKVKTTQRRRQWMPFRRWRRVNEKIHYLTLIKAYYAHYQHTEANTNTHSHPATLPPCRGTCMLTALNVSQRLDYVNSVSVCGKCAWGVSVRAGGQLSGESFTLPHSPRSPKKESQVHNSTPISGKRKESWGWPARSKQEASHYQKKKYRQHIGNYLNLVD